MSKLLPDITLKNGAIISFITVLLYLFYLQKSLITVTNHLTHIFYFKNDHLPLFFTHEGSTSGTQSLLVSRTELSWSFLALDGCFVLVFMNAGMTLLKPFN